MFLSHLSYSLLVFCSGGILIAWDWHAPGGQWIIGLYTLLIFSTLSSPSPKYTVIVSVMASILTALGAYLFDPAYLSLSHALARIFAVALYIATSVFVYRHISREQKYNVLATVSNGDHYLIIAFNKDGTIYFKNENFINCEAENNTTDPFDLLPEDAQETISASVRDASERLSDRFFNYFRISTDFGRNNIEGESDIKLSKQTICWRWGVTSDGEMVVYRGNDVTTQRFAENLIKIDQLALEERIEKQTADLRAEIQSHEVAQQALIDSNRRIQDFAESASDWFYEMDENLCFSYLSEKFMETTGISRDALIGKSREQLRNVSDTDDEWDAHVDDLKSRRPFHNFEYEFRSGEGIEKWFSVSGKPVHDENGRFLGYRGTGCDITKKKKDEERIRVLSKAVEQSPAQVMITSQFGIIEYVNPALELVTGYSSGELIGQHPSVLQSGNTPNEIYQDLWTHLNSGEVWTGEIQNRTKAGTIYWDLSTISPVSTPSGEITHFLAIKEDMTSRKMEEENRKALEIELQQAQKLEAIGQLAGGIAHEINTPVQYVGDNLRFLIDTNDDVERLLSACFNLKRKVQAAGEFEQETNFVDSICEEIDIEFIQDETQNALKQSLDGIGHVASIVGAMKEFSHPGSKEKTSVDLNHALKNTTTVCRNEWKYVASVEFNFDENLPLIACMPAQINQVFLNLVINAAHAIGEREDTSLGTIEISTRKAGKFVEIEISDNGVGIPQEIQNRIFEQFFTSKEVGKGTGQGLSLSQDIVVRKHGGKISFKSKPGIGTAFIISLPVEKRLAEERAA